MHQGAAFQRHHALLQAIELTQVVSGDQHGHAVVMELDEEIEDFVGQGGVEIAGRLIGEQQQRFCRQRAADRNPLLLATVAGLAEAAAVEAGVLNLHPEILKVFGRLRFRTSYGQNVMRHCVETAHIAAMIAREIGADVDIARAGGFLHDLGKAVDHEVEGTHAIIGADIARRFKVKDAIAHCIEAHHEEVEPATVEAVIVMMADAVSGGRPGARRESLENYIRRLETLESIAKGFKGVESAFAIQAGREIRIIVRPEQVDDLAALRIARDVSQKIEETMEYPGQIKVTVVRETRATEYAR